MAITSFSSVFANPKIVLFNDTSAWYHWGCTGTSTALKEGIRGLGFDIHAVPINVTKSLKEIPQFEQFGDAQAFDRFCTENKDIAERIKQAAAVVITGEGTMHGLGKGPHALLYLAYISKKFFGKHVEIVNHSAYPNGSSVYQTVYTELDFIAIREQFSQEAMKKNGISSTLSFDCLPLYIRDHYGTKKKTQEKVLVVAGSVAFTEVGAEQLCRYLETAAAVGFEIKVLIGAAAFPSRDDQSFVDFLNTHCKACWKLVTASSMEEWLDTINHATLLVSGRFHHSIAAFCLNTPFIALNSNTPKVHAICSFFNQDEPLHFSDPKLLDRLLLRTNAIISSPRVNNDAKLVEVYELAERNFDGLKQLTRCDAVRL